MTFIPSPQQDRIFKFVLNETGSLIIIAVAGAGKSTTIIEVGKLIPRGLHSVFLAFNKRIAEALKERLPYWIPASTYHAHCLKALRAVYDFPLDIKAEKTERLLLAAVDGDRSEYFRYIPFVKKLVSLAKSVSTSMPNLQELVEYHELICEEDEEVGIAYAQDVLIEAANVTKENNWIDFDDMIWLAHREQAPFVRADVVFVDEAQDLNEIQQALLPAMLKPTGRLVAVGDPHQSIYGFRGADCNSMANLAARFNCVELPLSVSYRCARSIVYEAQTYLRNNA